MPKVVVEFDADTAGAIRDVDKLKRSMSNVGDGIDTDLDSNLGKAEGKIKGFGTKMKAHGMALGAGFLGGLVAGGIEKIGDVIIDQLQKSITAASDLNETLSKTGELFGPQAPKVTQWSKGAAKGMGMSQRAALDAAGGFAGLGKAGGLAGDDLVSFSEGLTTTAADLASFWNTTPEDAMEALSSGLRGEAEPLRKYNILLDDATLRQEALAMGLIKTTKQALTPQQKVLASHAVIMKSIGNAAGDFERTQDGVANQQRVLTASVEDAQAALGQKLLPAFLALLQISIKVVDFIVSDIIPIFEGFGQTVSTVADAIVTAWNWLYATSETVWNAVSGAVQTAAEAIVGAGTWIETQWYRIGGAISGAAQATANAVVTAWNWLRDTSTTVWNAITGAVSAAANAIVRAGDWLQDQWYRLGGAISGAAKAMADGVVAAWNWLVGQASSLWGSISNAVNSGINTIRGYISGFASWVGGAWSGVAADLSRPFERAAEIISGIVNRIKGIWNSAASSINSVSVTFGPIPDWVPGIGGQSWTFDPPNVPTLARGAYVTRPTLALVGEGRSSEFVSPEPLLRRLIRDETQGNSRTYTINVSVAAGVTPAEVGRQVVDSIRAFERAAGRGWRTA